MADTKKKLKTFQWKGINKQGRELKDETDAQNAEMLRAFLAKQGLRNITIKEKPKDLFESKGRIKTKDVLFFYPSNGYHAPRGYASHAFSRFGWREH